MWEEKNNDSWEGLLKFSRAFKNFYRFIPYLFLSKLENVENPMMIEKDSFVTKTTLLPTVSVKIISI